MFFNNKKRIEQLEAKVSTMEEKLRIYQELFNSMQRFNETTEEKLNEIDEHMEGYRKYEEHKRIMKDSDEPWADFLVEKTPEDGRLKISYDWNKAMIDELRRQGFRANTESEMVGMLFSSLVSEHADAGTFTEAEMEEIKNA